MTLKGLGGWGGGLRHPTAAHEGAGGVSPPEVEDKQYKNPHKAHINIIIISRVAEPPLYWAAPAPEVRGPGADSGSDQIGSAPAPYTNIYHFELLKSELLMQVFFGSHLPL